MAWESETTSMVGSMLTMLLLLCGNNHIDHFFFQMPFIMQLSYVDTSFNEAEMNMASCTSLLYCLWVSSWCHMAVLPGLC